MISEAIQKSIEKIISKYEYGQFNIFDHPVKMEYDQDNKTVILENFYRHDYLLNRDTCFGLMNKAYSDIRLTHRNLFVARAFGKDDSYFRNLNSNHCFLLVNDCEMMNYCPVLEDKEEISHAIHTEPLVIDPSFRKITPASESQYVIDSLMNHSHNFDMDNTKILKQEKGVTRYVPLVLNDNKEVLYLSADFNSKHFLAISVQDQDTLNLTTYPLEAKVLDHMYKNDPTSYQFIEYFRDLPKTDVTPKHFVNKN